MQKYFTESVKKVVDVAEDGVKALEETVDTYARPARRSLVTRFPIFFTLLVTLGVSSTFLGLEQLAMRVSLLQNNPVIMLLFGVGVLILTGTLYKKLG